MGDAKLARGLVESFGHSAAEACASLEVVATAMEQAANQQDAVALRPLISAARKRLDSALAELKSLL